MNSARGIGEIHRDLEALEHVVATLNRRINHMDAQVANVLADVATLKTNVAAVSAEVASILAQLQAGIDAEDEAAITQAHADLVTANAALAALVPAPAPASAPVHA